ncbi:MAG: ABC-F family ATP-binding cassette domain-containing protein [Chlamydiia bacterium]|nr:ABC-F family ATP-binding cassette domain-containing protein [Chlamydiia bacterium]
MSPLISCKELKKAFGAKEILKGISFSLFPGQKVGVIGPNGAGKSTLLKILTGHETADGGEVVFKKGLQLGYVPQMSEPFEGTLLEAVLAVKDDEVEAKKWLSKVGFDNPWQMANQLSGGWQKKLDLAKAMASHPDVLLLDEPTNHLDLASILWLENFLLKEVPAYMVTSHDRQFLEKVTTQMMEVSPRFAEGIFASEGSYYSFIEKRDAFLKAQAEYGQALKSKVRREVDWLRTTPQARTTKSRSRIDKAHALIDELSDVSRRNKQSKLNIDFSGTERATRKLIAAKNISKRELFKNLDILLSPGTRLGILGPNGSGKSTLMKILAMELSPDTGTVKTAEGVQIVYFDQMREQLPLDLSIKEALSPNGEWVDYRGKQLHVNSWAKKFFFSPDVMDLPIGYLSGGERARLIIARLMLKPADVLFLDEPTNDLDIETLEVIEESLDEFPGAVVLITHDREMMDRIAQERIVLEKAEEKKVEKAAPEKKKSTLKVSFKDKFEYEKLGKEIDVLEREVEELTNALSDPERIGELEVLGTKLHEKEERLQAAFERWHELSDLIES